MPRCGNGRVEEEEECDDGNRLDHDGCTEDCLPEQPVWEQVDTKTAPWPQFAHAMAYHRAREVVVLAGRGEQASELWSPAVAATTARATISGSVAGCGPTEATG